MTRLKLLSLRAASCLRVHAAGRALAASSIVAACCLAAPGVATAQDATRGSQLFEQLECARCHGAGAAGAVGPSLAATERSLEEVTQQLRSPRGNMPAFEAERLSDDDVADIYAWLQSLPAEDSYPTWFGTDLINLPTPLMPGRRALEIHFSHRFSESISDAGRQRLGGLDSFAVPTFWFAYGITDWLQAHGGRSSNRATWEYGAKVELVDEADLDVPISASVVLSGAYIDRDDFVNKSRFSAEFPVGLRAHERVSIVAVPFLATNTDNTGDPRSDAFSFAFGLGATFRITPGHSIDVEWITNIGGYARPDAVDQWQVFWAIKVGGHLFQLGVTNSVLYTPDQMAPGAQKTGRKSDVRIGFNLVRTFHLGGGDS